VFATQAMSEQKCVKLRVAEEPAPHFVQEGADGPRMLTIGRQAQIAVPLVTPNCQATIQLAALSGTSLPVGASLRLASSTIAGCVLYVAKRWSLGLFGGLRVGVYGVGGAAAAYMCRPCVPVGVVATPADRVYVAAMPAQCIMVYGLRCARPSRDRTHHSAWGGLAVREHFLTCPASSLCVLSFTPLLPGPHPCALPPHALPPPRPFARAATRPPRRARDEQKIKRDGRRMRSRRVPLGLDAGADAGGV